MVLFQTCGWKSRRGKPAGAPRSRLRAPGEIRPPERSFKSPQEAVGSLRWGAKQRAECESVNFAAS
jgi:hypothetical protein